MATTAPTSTGANPTSSSPSYPTPTSLLLLLPLLLLQFLYFYYSYSYCFYSSDTLLHNGIKGWEGRVTLPEGDLPPRLSCQSTREGGGMFIYQPLCLWVLYNVNTNQVRTADFSSSCLFLLFLNVSFYEVVLCLYLSDQAYLQFYWCWNRLLNLVDGLQIYHKTILINSCLWWLCLLLFLWFFSLGSSGFTLSYHL